MKYFIRLAFYGRDFYGTQRQKKDRTIQGAFEEALSTIYQEDIKVTISSRLDRYVNAMDFALTFSTDKSTVTPEHLKYYLSRTLKSEIYIKEVFEVDESFSPRYDCDYKVYCYMIQSKPNYNPLLSPITFIPTFKVEKQDIEDSISLFKGQYDFRQFSSPEGDENTIITVDSTTVEEKDGIYYLRFKGKAFLRYQVRFMVGAILSYCQGKLSLDEIKKLLSGKEVKGYIKRKAEPQGLFLEEIHYPSLDKKELSFAGVSFNI